MSLSFFAKFNRLAALNPNLHTSSRTMASTLNLQTKVKLNSGHEIPLLGYGLWQT